ncbi:MAG: glycerol-3-phosphate acyltransferase [Rickettsiales bacterium]|jgi:glycerol-3-phosphate acyltransferase PlsY|nr:glycerol-3-phosphate acyltransferase [Rickettsiales bacterium]
MVVNIKICVAMVGYLIASFLLAGISFGYLVVKFIGHRDIRKYGSGNVGATNVWRTMGAKYGILTFLLDGFKSFLPVVVARIILLKSPSNIFPPYFTSLTLLFAVSGHIFSPWLGWHGGKGVSSFILGLLAMNTGVFLTMVSSWLLTFFIFRISGLAALVSIVVTTIGSYFMLAMADFYVILATTSLIFWAHRKNLRELIFTRNKAKTQ